MGRWAWCLIRKAHLTLWSSECAFLQKDSEKENNPENFSGSVCKEKRWAEVRSRCLANNPSWLFIHEGEVMDYWHDWRQKEKVSAYCMNILTFIKRLFFFSYVGMKRKMHLFWINLAFLKFILKIYDKKKWLGKHSSIFLIYF